MLNNGLEVAEKILRWLHEKPDITRAQVSVGNAIEHFAELYDHYKEEFDKEKALLHEESQKQKETISSSEVTSSFGGMPDPDDPDKDKKKEEKRKYKRNATQWKRLFQTGRAYRMAIRMTRSVLGPASALKLKEAIEKFKDTPGFNSIIRRIIDAFESARYSGKLSNAVGNIKGALWEVKVALKLEEAGSSVIELAKKIGNRDFDIITKLKAIECKSWHWAKVSIDKIKDLNSSLCSLKEIANKEGLTFEFWSEHPIVEPLKELLNKNQITYK